MSIGFSSNFFQKRRFTEKEISRYLKSAVRDFEIASKNKEPEVVFSFSYFALIKIGIILIASCGYRVKSRMGHHMRILEKMSEILDDEDAGVIGDKMRSKRNSDLYERGVLITQKESKYYLDFIERLIYRTEKYLKSQGSLF